MEPANLVTASAIRFWMLALRISACRRSTGWVGIPTTVPLILTRSSFGSSDPWARAGRSKCPRRCGSRSARPCGSLRSRGQPQIPLPTDLRVIVRLFAHLLEPQKQLYGLADQSVLLLVVELKTKTSGCDGRGQRGQRGSALQDEGPDAGPSGVEGCRGADDASPHDDQLRGRWRVGDVLNRHEPVFSPPLLAWHT